MIDSNRLVIVRLDPGVLSGIFGGHGIGRVESNWPPDAAVIDAWWDRSRFPGGLMLKVRSATFDLVPEGGMIPEWTPTMTFHTGPSMLFDELGRTAREMLGEIPIDRSV